MLQLPPITQRTLEVLQKAEVRSSPQVTVDVSEQLKQIGEAKKKAIKTDVKIKEREREREK